MSWLDQIKTKLTITTGDGKKYTPTWINAARQKDYNISEFDYPGLAGTFVDRGEPRGFRYNLELYFQGENHLDESSDFDKSADDKRAWNIEHPYYGNLIVQPASIAFDNSDYNVTKVSVAIIETITEDAPKSTIDPVDSIQLKKLSLDQSGELSLTAQPSLQDQSKMLTDNEKAYKSSIPIISLPEESKEYLNLFNQANTAINSLTASPILAMRAAISALNQPSKFTANVETRLKTLTSTFNSLRNKLANLFGVSSKQIYQAQAASVISSMAITAITPTAGNYTNTNQVLNTIDTLFANYNQFLQDLDTLQSPMANSPGSFIPDPDVIIQLNDLVNLTIASLFDIALSSKKERSFILEYDSNVIVLTHRVYGLDPDDANIDEFITNNNFGLEDYIQVKKGTKIVYYI